MSIRNWRPQAQLTATVRLSDLAAKNLVAWLAAQPLRPRTANEALNMALESLGAQPVPTEVAALRAACGRLSGELEELRDRLRLAVAEVDLIEEKAAAVPGGAAGDRTVQERAA
jgi:hypothetical protein